MAESERIKFDISVKVVDDDGDDVEECLDCNGTGDCSDCDGTGEYEDDMCEACTGTGSCELCEGVGAS